MILVTDKKAFALVIVDETILRLIGFDKYYRYLKLVRRIKMSTIKMRLQSVYVFWLWALANKIEEDEDLQLYFARYLVVLEDGFKINGSSKVDGLNEEIEYTVFESKPKQSSTIEKERAAVESFFKYMGTLQEEKYNLEKNFKAYSRQAKYNKGSSYGLRMSKYIQNILLDEVSILPTKTTSYIKGDVKAFPFQLFDSLLALAEPREKLLYLLCGTCSARRNQALNLTLYDIDYVSKNIWLVDPVSEDQLGFHGVKRKSFLRSEYMIDAASDYPHSKYGFKAPIPTSFKSRKPLQWLNRNYKELFFQTLSEYSPIPESLRIPRHPFFFVTNSGKRLSPEFVNDRFTRHLETLSKQFPEYAFRLNGLGIHSLRHMFGAVMATIEAKLLMADKAYEGRYVRRFTQEAMGHRNKESTSIYFNRPWDIDIELGEYFQALVETTMFKEYDDNRRKKYVKKN